VGLWLVGLWIAGLSGARGALWQNLAIFANISLVVFLAFGGKSALCCKTVNNKNLTKFRLPSFGRNVRCF
jgi:hypothetical protein